MITASIVSFPFVVMIICHFIHLNAEYFFSLFFFFTSEELKLGFEKDGAFSAMQSVALGTKEHNIRAKLPAEGLSVDEQVDCLLDQAMDPNVLGRVWAGWEPWI